MSELNWVESGDSWIETESRNYDYVIERGGTGCRLLRYMYDTDQLLSAIPCLTVDAAKTTAKMMEDLIPAQRAKLAEAPYIDVSKIVFEEPMPKAYFEQPDWRDP